MELEDLRTTWKSIEKDIENISKNDAEEVLTNNKRDIKTSLKNRFRWGIIILIVATILLGTSRLWAFIKMPVWWIGAFCILFVSGIVIMAFLIQKIHNINLGEDTQLQVMKQILSIKKIYRNSELYGCVVILALMIAGIICSPIPYRPSEIIFISIVTAICYFLEFLTYRSNIKKINKIQNWLNEP